MPAHRSHLALATLLAAVVALPGLAAGEVDPTSLVAPTSLYPPPPRYLLLPMAGDRISIRYTPGALDRSANLQHRLELLTRYFERWTGQRVEVLVFVLGRREWEQAGFNVAYGLPLRVGEAGLAVPAAGDDGTVELWQTLLDGRLPRITGTPILGSPEEAASLLVSDLLAQALCAEILVDSTGLSGDAFWVRGVLTQLISWMMAERLGTDRPDDVLTLYAQFLRWHEPRTVSIRDYSHDVNLADWLYFQAQFLEGARAVYAKAGKESLKKVIKLKKKGRGTVEGEDLRRKFKGVDEWLRTSFTTVSRKK